MQPQTPETCIFLRKVQAKLSVIVSSVLLGTGFGLDSFAKFIEIPPLFSYILVDVDS